MKPYYQDSAVTIYHGDCADVLQDIPAHDLLIADPPYGLGESGKRNGSRGGFTRFNGKKSIFIKARDYGDFDWDKSPVDLELLHKAMALCAKQVVWGGNYYHLKPTSCWLIWDKENTGDFAPCELAWTNFKKAVRLKRHMWNGMVRKGQEDRFHPTQKPLDVIAWAILQAGDDVQTILDPFAGSGTTGRAAKDLGKKATLIEREERYCEIAAKRMAQEVLAL